MKGNKEVTMALQRNKLALVTGAAQGIGFAISERLVDIGYSVAMLDHHPSVIESAKLLATKNNTAKAYLLDLSDLQSIRSLESLIGESFKDLSVSVNKQLSSIDSSIKFNNLLTGIQTYQMYKINQNTKRIN